MEHRYIDEARNEYERLQFDDSKVSQGMAIAEALTAIAVELEIMNELLAERNEAKQTNG